MLEPSQIQAVFFDLDGTLLDRRQSFELFIQDQWARFSGRLGGLRREQYVETLIRRDQNGYAPRAQLFTGMAAQFDLSPDLADTLLSDYRDGFPRACVLFPDALETLAGLRAAGLKLGLITNGSLRMQSRKIECLALAAQFDSILISAAEGVSKPDPEIFHRALERLNVQPSRAVFVGDHPEVDVAGARAAGLYAIWHRDLAVTRAVEADAVVDRIGDLMAVLRRGRG